MLVRQLTSSQLNDWMAYASIEPFGEQREELRHGQKMALTANLKRDPKQRPQPFKPSDFMNFIPQPPEKKLSPEEIDNIFKNMFGALGGTT